MAIDNILGFLINFSLLSYVVFGSQTDVSICRIETQEILGEFLIMTILRPFSDECRNQIYYVAAEVYYQKHFISNHYQ